MEKVSKIVFLVAALTVCFLAEARYASAANLYFYPNSGNFYQNENFSVSVFVNADQPINAVKGVVIFPTNHLDVISVNKNSILDLWIQAPSFSNAGDVGNVSFEGVVLNPGFSGASGKVLEIIFRPKKTGNASLNFSEFVILANDGIGTNVSASGGSASLLISPPRQIEKSVGAEIVIREFKEKEELEQRIQEFEEKLESIEITSPFLEWWDGLPKWVKAGADFFLGITFFILSLLVLSFSVLFLTWFWSYILSSGNDFLVFFRNIPQKFAHLWQKALILTEIVEKELRSDLEFTSNEMKIEVKKAVQGVTLFGLLANYFGYVKRVVIRFFERNADR